MKLGIVGSGMIVPEFLKACEAVGGITFQGISSTKRSAEKRKQLQAAFGIVNVHDDYASLLKDDVDAIYVAAPNHLHYELAKQALLQGHHVILEKPFTSTLQQAKELVDLAREKEVIIFEAISNQHFPNYHKIQALLPQLGDVKIVQLNYSQYSRRYDAFKAGTILPVFDQNKSGGALMDLNVYNIHFIVGLFGAPQAIHYAANVEKGVDTSGVLTLEYPTLKCVAVGAKDCASPVSISIQGDKGYIYSPQSASSFDRFTFGTNDGHSETFELHSNQHRLFHEVQHFVRLFEANDLAAAQKLNAHSLSVMEILTEARQQVGVSL